MGNAILVDKIDNVATVTSEIKEGEVVTIKGVVGTREVKAKEAILYGHKVALIQLDKGSRIIKYGKVIGYAKKHIELGKWVHTHNTEEAYVPPIKGCI